MNGNHVELEGRDLAVKNILNVLSDHLLEVSKSKGFTDVASYDPNDLYTATHCGLIHSEVSEAFEAFRQPTMPMSEKIPEFTLAEEEFADIIIRVLMFGRFKNMRIGEAVIAKDKYNQTRPFKHGGKRF